MSIVVFATEMEVGRTYAIEISSSSKISDLKKKINSIINKNELNLIFDGNILENDLILSQKLKNNDLIHIMDLRMKPNKPS